MTDEEKKTPSTFVTSDLGPWSSHPDMLAKQKRWIRFIGCVPFVLGILFAVLVVTNYRASDFAGVHDWSTFLDAANLVWSRCSTAIITVIAAFCVTWAFSVTMNLLWGLSRKISLKASDSAQGRDSLPCPPAVLIIAALFWLVPVILPLFKSALMSVDYRLYYGALVLSALCCFAPFALLKLWISCTDEGKGPPKYRHPHTQLFLWIFFFALAGVVAFFPEPAFIEEFIDTVFEPFVAAHLAWVPRLLGVSIRRLFWCIKIVIAIYFAWRGVVHFVKWRLKWVPKKEKKKKKGEEEAPAGEEGEDPAIPESAKYVIEHLPDGITLDGKIVRRAIRDFSQPSTAGDELGLRYLVDLPEDARPTEDQAEFFRRFVESYEEARDGFFENEDPRAPKKQADMLLHGADGSGRTTVLLASALYAAIVRGQRVLYVVPARDVANRLAGRVNARLRDVMVECYFRAGVLKPIEVGAWLQAYVARDEKVEKPLQESEACMPPDVLFATPEMIERCFFSNVVTIDSEKRQAMRRLLLDFNVFIIDDFLEYSLPVRSHLAFVMDKFRLLLATEFVVPQFVVATSPLDVQNCVEILGQRLFGFNRFNRRKNVFALKPRRLEPYLFGTLVVKRSKTLEAASRELLATSLRKDCQTLLYRRGISSPEKAKLDEDFKEKVKDGKLKVVSHLYELDERKAYENVFYLSLTCGNADAALRLNLPDGGTPVFFRIKLEGEEDAVDREAVVLLPDETAVSLRAFHLRSVLQYIPRLMPVEASVWSCLGIFRDHPNIKDAAFLEDAGSRVAVQWFQDDLPSDERYADGQIWPYLVLGADSTLGTRGRLIDFDVLPTGSESIWIDRRAVGREANRLLLARETEADPCRHLVSWRDTKNVKCGATDLAHTDEMVCRRKGVDGEDADEYTVGGLPSQDVLDEDSDRFAMAVTARYRQGTEDEFLYPIKRLKWSVPTKELEIVDLSRLDHLAYFKLQLKADTSCRVDGMLKGLLNFKGKELDYYPPRAFAYDAYMTCIVLHPTLKKLSEDALPEDYVRRCINGNWTTDPRCGFSSALTHALTAAFRQRFSGWSFFATAPVFYIEGREDSIGKAVMWLVEPSNSGRTTGPVLKALFEETKLWGEIFETACEILSECRKLGDLRVRSRLAFADEAWDDDDLAKALAILEPMRVKRDENGDVVEPDHEDEEIEPEEEDDAEEDEDGRTPKKLEPRRASASFSPEEKEFESVVLDGLSNFEDTIDVTKTAYVAAHSKEPKAIGGLFNDILWNHPEIFYVSKSARYQWWQDSSGKIVRFVIRDIPYGITQAQYPDVKAKLDLAVKEALGFVEARSKGVADGNGVEALALKAKLLHDFIVGVCEYDTEARDTHDASPTARTVYSVLVRHKAVCEGYTMAYRYLLSQVGIDSEEVLSDKMCHCWNYVHLGGAWYHVDVTWDDPVYQGRKPDNARISHEHFLLSDAKIRTKKHYAWDVRGLPAAADARYDDVNWA